MESGNEEDLVELVIKSLGRIQLAKEVSQGTIYNPCNPFDPLTIELISLYALNTGVPPLDAGRRYVSDCSFASAAVEWAKGISAGMELADLDRVLAGSHPVLKRLVQLGVSGQDMVTEEDINAGKVKEKLKNAAEKRGLAAEIADEINGFSGKHLIIFAGFGETNALYCQLNNGGWHAETRDETFTLGYGYTFTAFYDKSSGRIFLRPSCIDFEYGALNALIDCRAQFDGYRRKGLEVAQEIGEEVRDYRRFSQNSTQLALLHEQGERRCREIVEGNGNTDFIGESDPEKRSLSNHFFFFHPSGHDLYAEHYALANLNGNAGLARFMLLGYLLTYSEPSPYSNIMISCLSKANPVQELGNVLADIGGHLIDQDDPFAVCEARCREEVSREL